MGTTLVTYVGVGFVVPDDVLDSLGDEPTETVWEIARKYDLLEDSSVYFYDYFGETYIYIKRLTETYYGAHFSPFILTDSTPTDNEIDQLNQIQNELGFSRKVIPVPFVATSVG